MVFGFRKDYELLDDPERGRSHSRWRRSVFVAIGLLIAAFVLTPSSWHAQPEEFASSSTPDEPSLQQCPAPLPPKAHPPAAENIWRSLTIQETADIQAWLEAPERGLNLSRPSEQKSSLTDNIVFLIESHRPPKDAAVAYLDQPGSVAPPERFARVTLHHGAADVPRVQDYLVGPLPISQKTIIERLQGVYHRDEIPYNARGFASPTEMSGLFNLFRGELQEAMDELFGNHTGFTAGASGPFSFDGSFRRAWISWKRDVPGPWLHPLNFFQYVDITGSDMSKWKILKVVYNHQLFHSADSFLSALRNGTLQRLPHRPDDSPDKADLSWTTRRRPNATQWDLDDRPGPRSVSFAGLRFRVDKAQQFVSWMGWQMYLGFDRDMGMSLWDIRLKGERIIYELSPQEAIAQYAGNDPMQATTAWLDRFFGMGSAVRSMMPGYDCPHEAVYLPSTVHTAMGSTAQERAVCIFEQDTGRPITRHTGWMDGEFGAVKGYVLTVRSISTVGNYDYIFDYMFHLDGTIEVRVSASGYLQGGYWEPQQDGYGGRIRDTTMGNLHDHVINFKVDFDIAGRANSLLATTTAQETVHHPWLDADDVWGDEVIQQKITRRIVESESDSKLKWPQNFQGGYAIVNQDEKNGWGYSRGYAVHPGYNPIHNTVVGSKRLLNNANWARYNLAVSKRKDTEPSSSSMWNMNLPGAPMVDFHNFFQDEESIVQEDLVAWVNVGTHHLPQAEDSPNTKTNIAMSSFILTPLNYFDSDLAMQSSNAILLKVSDEKTLQKRSVESVQFGFDDYGVDAGLTCVPSTPPKFEYAKPATFDLDGKRKEQSLSLEDMRGAAELFHRIKF